MSSTWVLCNRDHRVCPMTIAGDLSTAENVVWGMIQSSDPLKGFDLCDFTFTKREHIPLDPGGMLMMGQKIRTFEIGDQVFKIWPSKIEAVYDLLTRMPERLPGWYRVGMMNHNVFISMTYRVSLLEAVKNSMEEKGSLDQLEQIRTELVLCEIALSDDPGNVDLQVQINQLRRQLDQIENI